MTTKLILVPVYGTPTDAAALDSAAAAAHRFGAHVEALHVRRNAADAVPVVGEGLSGPMVETIIEAAEQESVNRRNAARKTFEAWLERSKMRQAAESASGPGASWREMSGRPEAIVPRVARFADLVVAARLGKDELDVTQSITIEATIFACGRPILLAPTEPAKPSSGIAAIAWNGSTEATRAVAWALPFLAGAREVKIMTVLEQPEMAEDAEGLVGYLQRHGFNATVSPYEADWRLIGEALLGEAEKAPVDLLVLGAYSHSRLRRLVLGGVTAKVLEGAKMPVLMVH